MKYVMTLSDPNFLAFAEVFETNRAIVDPVLVRELAEQIHRRIPLDDSPDKLFHFLLG